MQGVTFCWEITVESVEHLKARLVAWQPHGEDQSYVTAPGQEISHHITQWQTGHRAYWYKSWWATASVVPVDRQKIHNVFPDPVCLFTGPLCLYLSFGVRMWAFCVRVPGLGSLADHNHVSTLTDPTSARISVFPKISNYSFKEYKWITAKTPLIS